MTILETVMKFRTLGFVAVILFYGSAAKAQIVEWQRYQIQQSGAAVDIPTSVFSRDVGEPKPGYGRQLTTSDGRANLTVQSFPNDAKLSPAAFLAKQRPPDGIIYRKITSRFFAVSSVRNAKIWYNRCNASGRFMNCILINYPAREKRDWDAIVTRISNTLATER
jgi:hypothetical protein